MKVLLDASAYIDLHKAAPQDENPLARAASIVVSSVTVGELMAGFKHRKIARGENEFRAFLAHPRVTVADVTTDTAEFYAELHAYLRERGRTIPSNDIWIAATAMQVGARILTSDRHFLNLPQVLVELV
jgi:tRNA(fMet)-specific endonuclease VapC